ncbi:hypothetical protein L6R53_30840 [Myxococcota bacterium]|nr:hypothetical protein [Myxococcota bacterium]
MGSTLEVFVIWTFPLLVAALACAPKQAPVTPPVLDTEPDLQTPEAPATVEDESAPPDDPEEGDVAAPEGAPADPGPETPAPDKPSPTPGN